MKTSAIFLLLALTSSLLASCASSPTAGKALDGVNQAGRAAQSVRAIQGFF